MGPQKAEGFHPPRSDQEGFGNAPWTIARTEDSIVWFTEPLEPDPASNPLRWGTLYNFFFDATAPPVRSTVTIASFKPGDPLGNVDDVHRRMLDAAGYSEERFAACGYSLGATFKPSWMDVPPMIYSGNTLEMRPGMVFFPHVMLGDKRTGIAVGLGNTVVVTDTGAESLSRLPLDLMMVS